MIQNLLSEESEAAAMRYEIVIGAWKSIYFGAISSEDFGTSRQMFQSMNEAIRIAEAFLEGERRKVVESVLYFSNRASLTTLLKFSNASVSKLSEPAIEHLREIQDYLLGELETQVNRDLNLLKLSMQRVSLEISLSAKAHRLSNRGALIEYRIGGNQGVDFMFADRAGRQIMSRKFVRSLWRSSLLSAYNETILFIASEHGIDRLFVTHPDPKSQFYNLQIAIGSAADLPTYSEIRSTVFHPNSDSYLSLEAQDVLPE
ncbi:MAG: hypothetical protein ACEQSB_00295 [Undibacterium sp.]